MKALEYLNLFTRMNSDTHTDALDALNANANANALNAADASNAVNAIPKQILKKYRLVKYDQYDKEYAIAMKNSFYNNINKSTQNTFNDFTDNLMEEPFIGRSQLIDAIEDYERSMYSRTFPLTKEFTDSAFNLRASCSIM
jgi:uncharacterized protein (DUF885 family)